MRCAELPKTGQMPIVTTLSVRIGWFAAQVDFSIGSRRSVVCAVEDSFTLHLDGGPFGGFTLPGVGAQIGLRKEMNPT